ncbi:hypothetical protein C9374_001654 [Naegleria lovaniensis]|uniref:Ubiquitin-like domain-containing protein n=1 Tax=Naegleria lovaniensis TaxID=51637 RepID=A0AA88GR34_NAELO|nr:uncharacterized protein C9374_001654 [Naegleria lovaniensis]KAG2387322.1 hypothetical protein C9374_001654 [Naegleria lovaniensis]
MLQQEEKGFSQLPSEIWMHIFMFLDPLGECMEEPTHEEISRNGSNPMDQKEVIVEKSRNLYLNNLRVWNEMRARNRIIFDAFKFTCRELDLHLLFENDMRLIQQAIEYVNPFEIKKSANADWKFLNSDGADDDYKLMNSDDNDDETMVQNISKILHKQDIICKRYLVNGIGNGFSALQKLTLDHLYRLQDDQLEELCQRLPNLTYLSIVNCNHLKKFDMNKCAKLEHIVIHVYQLELRIELMRQKYQPERMNRVRDIHIDVVGGLNLWLTPTSTTSGDSSPKYSAPFCYKYRVGDMKRIYQYMFGKDISQMQFIWAGKELMNERYLLDYCVMKESNIWVCFVDSHK